MEGMCSWGLSPSWCQFGLNRRPWNKASLGEWVTCIETRAFIILPSIVVVPRGPRSRSRAQTLLHQAYCKPTTPRQALPLRAGSPGEARCPAIVLLRPPAEPVLPCQQQSTCFSAGPHRRPGLAASRMLTTCHSVRCPACLRNGTMKALSFPRSPGRVLLDHLCYVLAAVPAWDQPHAVSLPASSANQCSPATRFASLDTPFCPHAQIMGNPLAFLHSYG